MDTISKIFNEDKSENLIQTIFNFKFYKYKEYYYYKKGHNNKYIDIYKDFKNKIND